MSPAAVRRPTPPPVAARRAVPRPPRRAAPTPPPIRASCVAYHDATCQRSHWKRAHKKQCRELARAMLPLKELLRWHKLHKQARKDGAGDGDRRRVWCWWEPDNENGLTPATLAASDAAWRRGVRERDAAASEAAWRRGVRAWEGGAVLEGVAHLRAALEPYRRAWPHVGRGSGTDEERRGDDDDPRRADGFGARSLRLARRLLFCGYCELDAGDVAGARQRLVQCLSVAMTVEGAAAARASRQGLRRVLRDAWMELMLSMEEVPEHRPIARHVARMAMTTYSCGWRDPLQRPGYMASGIAGVPFTPPDQHPPWCRILENNWVRILNEYNQLMTNPLNFSKVGSGQRGSGHEDGQVVSGVSWKEYVLFGTGARRDDRDAPITKRLLREHVPDAVSLAAGGGGEVVFSCLAPRTRIASHCGPTNLRQTAHLGLVVPDAAAGCCRLRVGDAWRAWRCGKVMLFDDSYEHEVRNDTDETRVVV